MKKGLIVVVVAILFIAIFITATNIYNSEKSNSLNEASSKNIEYMQRDYSPRLGSPDAKVTIVEFFDPACGTCGAFYPFVKQLMNKNKGKINLVLRYLPLHRGSDVIVSIFEAARLQGRFWETLELAYKTQDIWVINHTSIPEKFWLQLGKIGLNMQQLEADMKSVEIARRIRQDIADAQQLQVDKTPGFFVNSKPLISFGYQQLQQLVESEISKSY